MPSSNFNEDLKIPIRNHVINDVEVGSLIGEKFYGRQISTLDISGEDAFPMAVFYFETGGGFIVRQFSMVVRAYSNSTYDEAYQVHNKILKLLGGSGPVTIAANDGFIVVRPISNPTESYEDTPRIYGVGSRFLINWIS